MSRRLAISIIIAAVGVACALTVLISPSKPFAQFKIVRFDVERDQLDDSLVCPAFGKLSEKLV